MLKVKQIQKNGRKVERKTKRENWICYHICDDVVHTVIHTHGTISAHTHPRSVHNESKYTEKNTSSKADDTTKAAFQSEAKSGHKHSQRCDWLRMREYDDINTSTHLYSIRIACVRMKANIRTRSSAWLASGHSNVFLLNWIYWKKLSFIDNWWSEWDTMAEYWSKESKQRNSVERTQRYSAVVGVCVSVFECTHTVASQATAALSQWDYNSFGFHAIHAADYTAVAHTHARIYPNVNYDGKHTHTIGDNPNRNRTHTRIQAHGLCYAAFTTATANSLK